VLRQGSLLCFRIHLFGVPIGWRAEISDWLPPRTFTDTQVAGPYRLWVHVHRFAPVAAGTEIYDHVRYRVPGDGFIQGRVGRWLDEIFDYRARRLAELFG
jgi:ligand-binding SRPBCC domain-containing protein